jgi:hypothetical protein
MKSWSTILAALVALAIGTGTATAAEPGKTGMTYWSPELISIGRLGPLGTSNSLFSIAVAGGTERGAVSSRKQSDDTDDDKKGGVPVYAIAGGAAVGLGIFIAAVSGGSSDDLVNNNTPNDPATPFTPTLPGTTGGTNGAINPTTGGSSGTVSSSDAVTVTPEPASMALLASGLAGMGGFQLRRHRKRVTETE